MTDVKQTKRKVLTLAFIRDGDRLLLGMKKRGFGAGKWNGFGGKVDPGETILQGAVREMREECGAVVEPSDFKNVGTIDFEFIGDPVILEVHVFLTDKYSGKISESEEMRPQWYDIVALPYSNMWLDDERWYPAMLDNRTFKAYYLFQGHDKIVEEKMEMTN